MEYLSYYRSTNTNIKKKFLNSIAKAFKFDSQKKIRLLRGLFAAVGDVKIADSLEAYGEAENEEPLKNTMTSLFSILYSPFSDFEIEALTFLKGLF